MYVAELVEKNRIPEEIFSNLIYECPGIVINDIQARLCGGKLLTDKYLKRIECENPNCPLRLSRLVYRVCREYGLESITREKCESFVSLYNIESIAELFLYEVSDGLFSEFSSTEESVTIESTLRSHRTMSLKEYLSIFDISGIGVLEESTLSSIQNVELLYETIMDKGVLFIEELLFSNSKYTTNFDACVEALYSDNAYEGYGLLGNAYFSIRQELSKLDMLSDKDCIKKYLMETVGYLHTDAVKIVDDLLKYKKEILDGLSIIGII